MPSTWINRSTGFPNALAYAGVGATTETTQALNANYAYGTGGTAIAFHVTPYDSETLTDFWIKVISYGGTWGSTDGVINVQVREEMNGTGIPGTTVTGSFTITLDGSTVGWTKKSGLSISLVAGKLYTFTVGDADGDGTNFVTIARHYTSNALGGLLLGPVSGATTVTTAGFTSAGTVAAGQPAFVAKVGSLLYGGSGFSTVATTTNNQLERGQRFKPTEDVVLVGFVVSTDSSLIVSPSVSAFKVYADGTAPGGSVIKSMVPDSIASGSNFAPNVAMLPAADWTDLTGGTWYRVAVDFSANSTVPRKATIGGSPDSDVLSVFLPFNGNCHYIEEVAGPAWDDAQTTALCTFGPLLVPKTAVAGGGGLLVGGRLAL